MRYIFTFQFDNGSEKNITLESDLSLEQINSALYMFFQGRSPISDVVINPNRLLAIQITQEQQSYQTMDSASKDEGMRADTE